MWPGFDTCKVRLDSLSPRDTLADAETAEQISIIAGSFKSISLTHCPEEPIYDTDHTDLNSDFDEAELRAELLKDKWRFLFDKFDPEGFGEIPVNDFLIALKSPEFQSQVPLSKRELLYDRALLSTEPKGSGSVSFQEFVNVSCGCDGSCSSNYGSNLGSNCGDSCGYNRAERRGCNCGCCCGCNCDSNNNALTISLLNQILSIVSITTPIPTTTASGLWT